GKSKSESSTDKSSDEKTGYSDRGRGCNQSLLCQEKSGCLIFTQVRLWIGALSNLFGRALCFTMSFPLRFQVFHAHRIYLLLNPSEFFSGFPSEIKQQSKSKGLSEYQQTCGKYHMTIQA